MGFVSYLALGHPATAVAKDRLETVAERDGLVWVNDSISTTPESEELAKVLRRAGFRFIGPTTVHAAMQACGVVNDHIATCYVRAQVQREIDATL